MLIDCGLHGKIVFPAQKCHSKHFFWKKCQFQLTIVAIGFRLEEKTISTSDKREKHGTMDTTICDGHLTKTAFFSSRFEN